MYIVIQLWNVFIFLDIYINKAYCLSVKVAHNLDYFKVEVV